MMKSLFLSLGLLVGVVCVHAQTRIVPHVTNVNGGFSSTIVMENASGVQQSVTLQPYDSAGNALTPKQFDLAAGTNLRGVAQTLLEDAVSHFTIDGPADMKVNIFYDFKAGNASPAFVGESNEQGSRWRMFPGNWDQVFDGIAVVNRGTEPTDIWLAEKDDDNQVLKSIKIAEGLAPNAKALYVIGSPNGSEFTGGDHFFEVSGDQLLAVTALQGTLENETLNILLAGESRPLSGASSKRDDRGVWFIEDGTLYDVIEMMGYNVATDRLFQLDLYRRQGHGTLGELFPITSFPQVVELDTFLRKLAYSREQLDQIFMNLDSETRLMIQAYVDGINRRIGEVNSSGRTILPVEYTAYGESSVDPYSYHDVMAHIANLQRSFSMRVAGAEQVSNAALLQDLQMNFGAEAAADMFNDHRYVSDPESLTVIDDVPAKFHQKSSQARLFLRDDLPDFRRDALAYVDRVNRLRQTLKDRGMLIKGGSYSWAVHGSKTASGNPILYGGPQVGFNMPSLFVEGSVQSEALTVSGMSIPGFPSFIVGRTPHHAWSLQVGHASTWDYYVEQPEDIWVDRTETLTVKGGTDVELDIEVSEHGPIMQELGDLKLAFNYAHRGYEFNLSQGLLKLSTAESMDEFGDAVRNLGVSQHITYVDRDGNIGYWHSGRDPVRQPGDYRLPQGLVEGQPVLEWSAADVKPVTHARNPEKGYFAGWNNKSDASFDDASATNGFGPYHRGHAIRDFFDAYDPDNPWTFEELRDLAVDIGATGQWAAGGNPWTQLGEAVVAAINGSPTAERQDVLDMFQAWDGHAIDGGPGMWASGPDLADASVLLDALIPKLLTKTFDDELGPPRDTLDNISRFQVFLHGLYDRGLNNAYDWYSNLADPDAPQTADAIILASIDELLVELGNRPWGIGARPGIFYSHIVFGATTFLTGLQPSPGGQRGTYAQAVEYGPDGPIRIESTFAPGQSGTILGDLFNPDFDENCFSMKEEFDAFILRTFPLFDP